MKTAVRLFRAVAILAVFLHLVLLAIPEQVLKRPIQLKHGEVLVSSFRTWFPTRYDIDLDLDRAKSTEALNCLLGADLDPDFLSSKDCPRPSKLHIRWTVFHDALKIAEGTAVQPPPPPGTAGYDAIRRHQAILDQGATYWGDSVGRTLGSFQGRFGAHYRLEIASDDDRPDMTVAHPKIIVRTGTNFNEQSLVWPLFLEGIFLVSLLALILLSLWSRMKWAPWPLGLIGISPFVFLVSLWLHPASTLSRPLKVSDEKTYSLNLSPYFWPADYNVLFNIIGPNVYDDCDGLSPKDKNAPAHCQDLVATDLQWEIDEGDRQIAKGSRNILNLGLVGGFHGQWGHRYQLKMKSTRSLDMSVLASVDVQKTFANIYDILLGSAVIFLGWRFLRRLHSCGRQS